MNARHSQLCGIVGTRLRLRRRALGVSQRDLAQLSGVAVHTLSNIESGTGNPSLDVLEKLLDCLGLDFVLQPRTPADEPVPEPSP